MNAGEDDHVALLVDDEQMVRMSTADMLSELGFTVHECGSAELADHLMPGMTGGELARACRALHPGVPVPVPVISGFAESEGLAADAPPDQAVSAGRSGRQHCDAGAAAGRRSGTFSLIDRPGPSASVDFDRCLRP